MANRYLSTGLPELDQIIGGVLAGDNIVWQVEEIENFYPFVTPYYQKALERGKTLVYFRFAGHPPLIPSDERVRVYELHPGDGFEVFLSQVHDVIERSGRGAYYVFDCLSDLVADWYSDQMLANFFMLTCPYLYDLETVTYFPLIANSHSFYATSPITETTQIFISVYHNRGNYYLRPMKALHRYSATMYMLHVWKDSRFKPVSQSVVISEILAAAPRPQLQSGGVHLDLWNRTFAEAKLAYQKSQKGLTSDGAIAEYFYRLLRMAISRDRRMLELCEKYLTLGDILEIGERIIGTGLIGGKSVGMLLSRAILKKADSRWNEILEKHDSFFVASDVFYTYLVKNGCWWGRESIQNQEIFLKGASEIRRQILRGSFPDYLLKQFSDMLDYFGQSPIIVRSSSLLEDSFGHAFAGKYESVFCANQGPEGQRLEDFLSAIRAIYASTMSENALQYRARHDLLRQDEQMALLVQRVSGSMRGNLFYPQLAGVGFSYNPYAWHEAIDPNAGVLRLVFGLGTRAVERSDDDYTRLLALNAPNRLPGEGASDYKRYSQKKVDVLDLAANLLLSNNLAEVVKLSRDPDFELFASRDPQIERLAREKGLKEVFSWTLDFAGVISDTGFVSDMQAMLKTLHQAYQYPVDVEFTANLLDTFRINLVQCRPFQVQEGRAIEALPSTIDRSALVLSTEGAVIGRSRICTVDRLIYVEPSRYAELSEQKRYAVARLIGDISRLEMAEGADTVMLIGPGRWGTTLPQLGVPVSFAEINRVSILCEVVAMRDGLVPDVSLGTHFFNDLVETDMLYLALFPGQSGNHLNDRFFAHSNNAISRLLPGIGEELSRVCIVIDITGSLNHPPIRLHADALEQKAVCYLAQSNGSPDKSYD
ncbi:MAG: pyruvate, phosphate dikinase [Deltaproteobacteria bacterium]|nr:pyruvate, phosphate dikinase [Deltaproteobacteria bacterium]